MKASSHYDKACHLADLGASLRDAVHARDAKKETLDRVAQDAGTGGRRSRRDITRDLKRLQDEKEAAVNKRAQVCLSVFVIARAPGRTPYAATHHANPRALTVRERRGGAAALSIARRRRVDGVAPPRHRAGTVKCDVPTGRKR